MVVQRTVPTVERFCWWMTRVPSTLVRISSNQLRDVRAALHMLLEARNALENGLGCAVLIAELKVQYPPAKRE
jgi:hypothetical protein